MTSHRYLLIHHTTQPVRGRQPAKPKDYSNRATTFSRYYLPLPIHETSKNPISHIPYPKTQNTYYRHHQPPPPMHETCNKPHMTKPKTNPPSSPSFHIPPPIFSHKKIIKLNTTTQPIKARRPVQIKSKPEAYRGIVFHEYCLYITEERL